MKHVSEMRRSASFAVLSWLFALALVSPAAAQQPKVIQIVIDKVAFAEVKVPLKIGDTIEWINKDVVDHTATAKNKDWDVELPAGKKVRMVLKKAGTVEYFCRYHQNMTGKISVSK